jgi:hypothetical protein
MADAPTVGVPAMIVAYHRPIARGRVPPAVMLRCWLGESSCTDICLGLFICRDVSLCMLTGVGPRLTCWFPPQ